MKAALSSLSPLPLPGNLEAIANIKAWMRQSLSLGPDKVLSVSELACAQEGCPPLETVILVMAPGEPARRYSVHKGLRDVCESDIRACAEEPPVLL